MTWSKPPELNNFQKEKRAEIMARKGFEGFLVDGKTFLIKKSGKWGKGKRIRFVWFENDYVRYHAIMLSHKDILCQVGADTIDRLGQAVKGWKHGSFR